MEKPHKIAIGRRAAPEALDRVLAKHLSVSRKKAKALLDDRRVFVNGKRTWMARHEVKPGDLIEVHTERSVPTKHPLHLLYEDDSLLVLDKPTGMLSVGAEGAVAQLAKTTPGLRAVHRLDRDTSGCLLVARSEAMRKALVELFEAHAVKKEYEAVVAGRVARSSQTVRHLVDGLSALTRVTLLGAGEHASHVRATIETGRTHQIRIHLLSLGHPVLGDKNYGTRRQVPEELRAVPRQMLHASRITFLHPENGSKVDVRAPLPADMRKCLNLTGLHR